jgi:hypothetical protein
LVDIEIGKGYDHETDVIIDVSRFDNGKAFFDNSGLFSNLFSGKTKKTFTVLIIMITKIIIIIIIIIITLLGLCCYYCPSRRVIGVPV